MKKVLVVTYSQSGQLETIVENILKPIQGHVSVDHERLRPIPGFPFPWTDMNFWDAMPESVRMIPSTLAPLKVDQQIDYDLIILGYPIWFLSPPIPMTTFLKSDDGKRILQGKPVVTVIGSRNMWVGAQEDMKRLISDAGGKLRGNIVLRDRHHNLPSVVTIIYWMMTGKKERAWGIFPIPGISDKDIMDAKRFGKPIVKALQQGNYEDLQQELLNINAVETIPCQSQRWCFT
ncbi:MAG: dialkylresorcinol condensing enzyme DarA [bacterium]